MSKGSIWSVCKYANNGIVQILIQKFKFVHMAALVSWAEGGYIPDQPAHVSGKGLGV